MRTRRGPTLAAAAIAVLVAAAGLSPASPADGRPERMPRILYRPGPLGHERQIVALLDSLAAYFRPAAVGVQVGGDVAPDRIEVRGPDGQALFAGSVEEVDLYQAQLAIHRHLFPDSACTYLGQVEALLRAHADALPAAAPEVLFLPPGCSPCMLQKHAARITELLADRPDVAVAAFAADAAAELSALGWRGRLCLLPETNASVVLGLRRAGVYLPVVARRTGGGRFALSTLSGGDRLPTPAAAETSPGPAAVPLRPAPAPVEHSLRPVAVFEGAGYMGEPVDIEHDGHDIYVLDAVERTIWILDERGGEPRRLDGAGPARFREPVDLFFGCGGRLFVTDIGDRAIHELDRAGGRWRRIAVDHRPFYGCGAGRFILTGARRDAGDAAVDRLACDGSGRGHLGSRLATGHALASVDNNANYTLLATDGRRVAIGHIGLGLVELLSLDDEPLGRFVVDTPQARALRAWYLGLPPAAAGPRPARTTNAAAAAALAAAAADEPVTLARTLADLEARARPERFELPVYLGDLQLRGERVLVLTNGVIDAYDLQGRCRARYLVDGTHRGERVVIHDFVVTRDGRLLGLDAAHYKKVYDFGPLPGG